ncbi:hypothetical protein RN001_002505 [Aquatica leii]|uniref:Uncharacterized protein n=1 Tax=Aquatica leii TaxID=1421715 RepID=A0AAN7Q5E6_9COLE|nr:hypothetical protein RN001_002505 [Aquatica leii]
MEEYLPPIYSKDLFISTVEKQPRGSARAQDIYKRSMLKSSDGQVLDDHDQFYRDHKLLLKLFQVLGAMPIQRGVIGRITFSWFSIPSIYAYCFYLITTIIVMLVGYERILILTTKSKKFDEYIYSVIFVLYLMPHFWIPFTGWSVAKQVCDYKNSWGTFQLYYYKITGKSLEFPYLSTLIVIISSGCLVVAVIFLITLSSLLDGFTLYHTLAYYHIVMTINMNCALWYINCRAIGNASKCVADSFEKDMDERTCAYIINHYRLLWLRLSDIVQKLGNAYARTYSAYSLFMLTNITVAIYGFTSEIVDHGFRCTFKEIGLLVDTTYCTILLFVFCDCSHQASINIANRVQTKLMNVQLTKVDLSTAREIELFLVAIRINSPKVSLQGYTVVNRELVSSMIGTITIYLIVLLQFKISLVRLTGKDAQKLLYDWKINFKTNSTCSKQQRCTLLIWKSVRKIEKIFNNKTVEIKINNTLLIPTVQYVLNVTIQANNTSIDTKQFILECTNNTALIQAGGLPTTEKLNNNPAVSLQGSNVTYRDMTYTINAEAINCVENKSYHYKWEVLDKSKNVIKSDFVKGSVLTINGNLLTAEKNYVVRCSIIDSQNASVLAMATKKLQVLNKKMVLIFTVRQLCVGLNKTFKLSAYFQDDDNQNGKIKIQWTCTHEKNASCDNFKSLESTLLEDIKLSNNGKYNFTITISKNNVIISDSTEVVVISKAYTGIEVDDIDVPVDPSKEIVVPVYITSLVTGCFLQWTSLNLKQYGYIDLSKMPGNLDVKTNITIAEDAFLNEIDEYTNSTVDKGYNLIIPKPDDKWLGVKGNTSYLFRLNVTCPDLDDEDDFLESAEQLETTSVITLIADVLIYTDTPPIIHSLRVNPVKGTALKTPFAFYTDLNIDESFTLYKFGYILNNHTVFIGEVLGIGSYKNVLPYIENGVQTVLEKCNRNNLCSRVTGPTVLTSIPVLSEDDETYFIVELNELMKREEYNKLFIQAVAVLQTYESIKNVEDFKAFEAFVTNLTTSEIKRMLKSSLENENWITLANNLINNVGILLNKISASDELLNHIITLRNKLSNKKKLADLVEEVEPRYTVRKILSIDRIKRETERISLEEVKRYLVISELIITTSNDKNRVQQEKQHLLNQIDKFMVQLCGTLYEKSQTMNLDLNTVSLSIEKLNKNNVNRYFHILHDSNAWKTNGRIKLGKCFIENLTFTNELCLGKALLKNYLDKDDFVYMIKVYGTKPYDQLKIQNMLCDAVLVLPVDHVKLVHKEPKCTVWKGNWQQSQCNTLQVASKTIQCQCTYLGYYSLQYNDVAVTTAKPLLSSPPVTTSGSNNRTNIVTSMYTTSTVTTMLTPTTTNAVNTALLTKSVKPKKYETEETSDNVTNTTEPHLQTNNTVSNKTDDSKVKRNYESEIIYYCVTGFSLIGTAMFGYGIKRLLSKSTQMREDSFPKYENIHNKDLLEDFSESNASLHL